MFVQTYNTVYQVNKGNMHGASKHRASKDSPQQIEHEPVYVHSSFKNLFLHSLVVH